MLVLHSCFNDQHDTYQDIKKSTGYNKIRVVDDKRTRCFHHDQIEQDRDRVYYIKENEVAGPQERKDDSLTQKDKSQENGYARRVVDNSRQAIQVVLEEKRQPAEPKAAEQQHNPEHPLMEHEDTSLIRIQFKSYEKR